MSLQDNLDSIENLIRGISRDFTMSLNGTEARLRERIAAAEKKLNSSIGCEDEDEEDADE